MTRVFQISARGIYLETHQKIWIEFSRHISQPCMHYLQHISMVVMLCAPSPSARTKNELLPPLLKKMMFWLLYAKMQKNVVMGPTTVLWTLKPLPHRSMHRELMTGPFVPRCRNKLDLLDSHPCRWPLARCSPLAL